MKKNIKLMAPQWIEYPALSEFSMGWRMGAGEDYKCDFWNWYETLSPEQQREFLALQQMGSELFRNRR